MPACEVDGFPIPGGRHDGASRGEKAVRSRHRRGARRRCTHRSRSIHLKSNITLQLATGATIRAAGSGFDAAEPNPFSRFQDFGHSHFHNALMWGSNVSNITITGTGTIDGDGLATYSPVPAGVGDKILSLKLCANITLRDVTFRRGGHFAILTNGCHD